MKKHFALLCCTVLLAGCGGGGGGASNGANGGNGSAGTGDHANVDNGKPTVSNPAAGIWMGTSSAGQTLNGVVLDNGTYFMIYGNSGLAAGFVQGTGIASNGNFVSNDARDFNMQGLGILDASLSAGYHSKASLGGTVTYRSNGYANNFTTNYYAGYDTNPSLGKLAGSYAGSSAITNTYDFTTITIGADGTISGRSVSGCTLQGKAAPHASGNVYDLTVTFGSSPCLLSNQALKGIAFLDSGSHRLYAAVTTGDRSNAALFIGQ